MSSTEFPASPVLVTGASRGFGRAIVTRLSHAGAPVVGVARDDGPLQDLRAEFGAAFTPVSPLDPGSTVITLSSGAALRGSPLRGGYAGAKATIRFITSYAAAESERDHLGIRFVSVLPQLTPATVLGAAARGRIGRPRGPGCGLLPGPFRPGAHRPPGRRRHRPAHLRSRLRLGRLPAHRS